jgi:hypothetical protein
MKNLGQNYPYSCCGNRVAPDGTPLPHSLARKIWLYVLSQISLPFFVLAYPFVMAKAIFFSKPPKK